MTPEEIVAEYDSQMKWLFENTGRLQCDRSIESGTKYGWMTAYCQHNVQYSSEFTYTVEALDKMQFNSHVMDSIIGAIKNLRGKIEPEHNHLGEELGSLLQDVEDTQIELAQQIARIHELEEQGVDPEY